MFNITPQAFFFTAIRLILLAPAFAFVTFVQANDFLLSQSAQLTNRDNIKHHWLTPIANPANDSQFFIASRKGLLFIVDDNILQNTPLLDIAQHLNNSEKVNTALNLAEQDALTIEDASTSAEIFKLTALTLHPSFALNGEEGFNSFYTAHIELHREKSTKRLTDGSDAYAFIYNAVITQWQLSEQLELTSTRELLRIAVPSMTTGIEQLSFNANVTKWQDDFGQLYAVLPEIAPYQTLPLYSGAVLRIHPAQKGLHDYTVPADNPFTKDINTNNELLLIGAQNISHINWYEDNSKQLIVTHQYDEKTYISLAEHIHDWRNNPPKEILFNGDEQLAYSTIVYQGEQLSSIKDKLLFLQKNNKEWQLHSTHAQDLKQSVLSKTASKLEWPISAYQLSVTSKTSIFADNHNELLLLDHKDNVLFNIVKPKVISRAAPVAKAPAAQAATSEVTQQSTENNAETSTGEKRVLPQWVNLSTFKKYVLPFLAIAVLLVLLYLVRNQVQHQVRRLLRQNFVRFELNVEAKQLNIFKKTQIGASFSLALADIAELKISLNNEELYSLSNQSDFLFTDEIEQLIRKHFKDEYQNKMFDHTVRKIDLMILDQSNKHFLVSPYLRQGNQRMTNGQYFDVVEQVVDLCWALNPTLHPGVKVERVSKKADEVKPVFAADAQSRPNKQSPMTAATKQQTENQRQDANQSFSEQKTITTEQDQHDDEVVDALEKLVNMKREGLLTEQEFSLAKQKLLQ